MRWSNRTSPIPPSDEEVATRKLTEARYSPEALAVPNRRSCLLAFLRCVCLQMKDHSGGQRIEYAARLMHFGKQALKEALQLGELVKNPQAHRDRYAAFYRNLPRGPVEQKLNSAQFAHFMTTQEQQIERSMQADRDRCAIELSNVIPDEVMDQAFELLSITREEVERQLDAEQQERKA